MTLTRSVTESMTSSNGIAYNVLALEGSLFDVLLFGWIF